MNKDSTSKDKSDLNVSKKQENRRQLKHKRRFYFQEF